MAVAAVRPTQRPEHAAMTALYSATLAEGPGVPAVMAHALGLDHHLWDAAAVRWQGLRPVLAYDQHGHGQSPASSGSLSLDDLVTDAVELIEDWGRGPVVFVGLSLGGMVGQGLALRRPDLLRGLVLAHTVARYDDAAREAWRMRSQTVRHAGMAAVVETVLARYLTAPLRERRPEVAQALRQTLLRNNPVGYAAACDAIADVDWLDRLPGIQVPTLLIAGAYDVGAPPAGMRQMQSLIGGAQLSVLPDASHLGPVEQPDNFWALVDDFMYRFEAEAPDACVRR